MQRDYKVLHNAPSGKNDITTRHTVYAYFHVIHATFLLYFIWTVPRGLVERSFSLFSLSLSLSLPSSSPFHSFCIPFRLSTFRFTFCLIHHLINTPASPPFPRSIVFIVLEGINFFWTVSAVLRSIVTNEYYAENRVNNSRKNETWRTELEDT